MSSSTASDTVRLFVEHVTHIDCGVLDAERGLHGATWLVDAVLSGAPDEQGMLFDFGPAKKLLKAEIDALVDHRLLVPTRAPGMHANTQRVDLTTRTGERYRYEGPETAITRLAMTHITPEALAEWITARVAPKLPDNVSALCLVLREESIDGPVYDYTHGLSAHDGNCQRLAHGHRCRLAVSIDDHPRTDIAHAWARAWQGVFIASRDQLQGPAQTDRLAFAYEAAQGRFAIELAAERCVILDAPATVENIAAHIATALAGEHPGRHVCVRAYEGVGKGAIVERCLPG